MIKAALLDEQGVFLRMDELASENDLTPRHVKTITECDLPPGRYKWVPGTANRFGGEFVDVESLSRRNRPEFDRAFEGLCRAVEAKGIELPAETKAWLDFSMKRSARRRARGGKGGK